MSDYMDLIVDQSEEDANLKSELEMLVERLQVLFAVRFTSVILITPFS
jgi:hypothetical protein